ncbi:unnamed protein product [Phytophthora lilii]|uniref:Unnamed protein product n=1 Tax=Phytophthora lilii TaxID=2077276 RepID=A0A9W6XG94_9STRA|nr:unnamed protein product [Phytophthora lilii]
MPPRKVGRPPKKRQLEPAGPGDEPKPVKRGPGRPPKKKKKLVAPKEPAPEPEAAPLPTMGPETKSFLQLLEDDARRLPPPPPPLAKRRGTAKSPPKKHVVDFQLPFKEAEIKSLEERQWVRRPPPFGRISRCVYVSTTMPIADFPVHKCTCCEETHKSMTKRTTMMASAKAQKELETNGRCPLTRHADLEKQHEMEAMVYCGEGCYNRMLFISCSDETCSAPDSSMCSNRAIKRRELKSVRVEYIPGPGFGLIANEKINAGEFIIEYVGEVIDDIECERRMIKYRDNGEVNFYMMELEKNIVIDAKYRSNESRFINHSCDPNSVTQKWYVLSHCEQASVRCVDCLLFFVCGNRNVDGIQRIGIFARRNIAPNEEITIDYNFSHFGEAADCKCGSTACTGKIGLKRSKLPSFNPRVVGTAKAKKQVPVDEEPPELKRPVHLTSLALLKSAQMDDSWLDYYGFKNRRLFLSHRSKRQGKDKTSNSGETRQSPPSSSPASECSTTTEEDVSLTPPQAPPLATQSKLVKQKERKRNWYEKVIAGEHLPEMRALHSYICGGKSDWTADLIPNPTVDQVAHRTADQAVHPAAAHPAADHTPDLIADHTADLTADHTAVPTAGANAHPTADATAHPVADVSAPPSADVNAPPTADVSGQVTSPSPVIKRGPGRPPKKRGRPKKVVPVLPQPKRTPLGTKLIYKRLGLSQARSRGIDELAAFANGKSKWNKRIPSSSTIDPDRIHRLIDRVKGKQIFINTDQNDLNEDACFRCGLAGELICCDGCPAAFHLNCTNLAMVPPDGIPWFCSECTNPKHLQKASDTSDSGIVAARGTRSSGRATQTDYAGRHLRTHAAHAVPSLKKIFHSSVPHAKRRYKKRHKATVRSYQELEHMPLPVWNESDESEAEQAAYGPVDLSSGMGLPPSILPEYEWLSFSSPRGGAYSLDASVALGKLSNECATSPWNRYVAFMPLMLHSTGNALSNSVVIFHRYFFKRQIFDLFDDFLTDLTDNANLYTVHNSCIIPSVTKRYSNWTGTLILVLHRLFAVPNRKIIETVLTEGTSAVAHVVSIFSNALLPL